MPDNAFEYGFRDRIITIWKTAHRRRRNLWTEMANLKLPGLDR